MLFGRQDKIQQLIKVLQKQFKLTQSIINDSVGFLGCIIARKNDGTYTLSQTTYLGKIIDKFKPETKIKPTPLPLTFDPKSFIDGDRFDSKPFQEKLGSLGYLRSTRSDILFALHQLAKWASRPTDYMYYCMQHLFGYLKGTKELVKEFYTADLLKTTENLVALTNASFYGKSLLKANSSTQKQISTSAPEAELY